jgi:hypothetical protein
MKDKLNSRKLWIVIIGIALQFINGQLATPMTEDQMLQITGLVVGYIVAQGWVDGKERGMVWIPNEKQKIF